MAPESKVDSLVPVCLQHTVRGGMSALSTQQTGPWRNNEFFPQQFQPESTHRADNLQDQTPSCRPLLGTTLRSNKFTLHTGQPINTTRPRGGWRGREKFISISRASNCCVCLIKDTIPHPPFQPTHIRG